ncbi:MAG: 30S ribosomal protein S11 [Candidatus Hodgkinia cicadicola]
MAFHYDRFNKSRRKAGLEVLFYFYPRGNGGTFCSSKMERCHLGAWNNLSRSPRWVLFRESNRRKLLKIAMGATQRNLSFSLLRIAISQNNVIATCSDGRGNVFAWTSAGERGFKGAKKASPFAAQVTIEAIVRKSLERGSATFEVEVAGRQSNRDVALRTILGLDVTIATVKDVTPVSHNGCRGAKRRRT